jgi:hypothetical protein
MVIMPNTIQTGWDFGPDDNIIDNISKAATTSFKCSGIPTENDEDPKVYNIPTKVTHNHTTKNTDTDEEGWTTTSPGKKKPKNNNSSTASTESIITSIDGNCDRIEAGMHNRIYVTSPERKHKCNIPDDSKTELDFNPTIMTTPKRTGNGKELNLEGLQDSGEEELTNQQNSNTNSENNNGRNANGKKDEENEKTNKGNNHNGGRDRGERSGSGGRGGRGSRRTERKQIPRTEWETYDFSISFNPKTMSNKDPDAEFQALLSQIMRKSPGVIFHPTNEDMFPKPSPFTNIQEYPKTEAAFKDFFDVYENKGLTTFKIFVRATMQYNELELRNSLLNYLRSNNLWMSSELISENVDEMIGYINYGHDKLVWRPECEKKINNGIQALIQSGSISEALRLKIEGLKKEIHVRVATGSFRGGTRNDPVMCEGLVLRTTKAQARACIELLGLLDENILGDFYSIIPKGIDKELGPKLYGDLLRTNNDMLNTLRSIAVVNWPEELFLDHYNPAPDVTGTVAIRIDKLFTSVWNCVAIEKTTETDARGKYLLIFREIDMEKAKESLSNLIEAFGRDSGRKCAKLALEKFHEFPEFDSIQRVSQSVHSKGLRIREMLESAAAQKTSSTTKKIKQPKFQFHVNKELQRQLPIATHKSYSSIVTNKDTQKKQLTIVQPSPPKTYPITRPQQPSPSTQATFQSNNQEARTVATNNSGLSVDQQTITTMMTQITNQFKDMERERIEREERQEKKRQEREAKAEEKRDEREARIEERRIEAQQDMYKFMQTMMTININQKNDTEQIKAIIPDELLTGTTEQTSAITTSIVTATSSTPSAKRSSSQLSNSNEETEMNDTESELVRQETDNDDDALSIKRNKTLLAEEDKEDDIDKMAIDDDIQDDSTSISKNNDTEMTKSNSGSFTMGFNNQQFKSTANDAPWQGVSQQ